MIRDRKMYVAPTPFGLASGLAHNQTLILPNDFPVSSELKKVGTLIRNEAYRLIIGYTFDLNSNSLIPKTDTNPYSGKEHIFQAFRLKDGPNETVKMIEMVQIMPMIEVDNSDDASE